MRKDLPHTSNAAKPRIQTDARFFAFRTRNVSYNYSFFIQHLAARPVGIRHIWAIRFMRMQKAAHIVKS